MLCRTLVCLYTILVLTVKYFYAGMIFWCYQKICNVKLHGACVLGGNNTSWWLVCVGGARSLDGWQLINPKFNTNCFWHYTKYLLGLSAPSCVWYWLCMSYMHMTFVITSWLILMLSSFQTNISKQVNIEYIVWIMMYSMIDMWP